jgi:hypothetical protein
MLKVSFFTLRDFAKGGHDGVSFVEMTSSVEI